MLKIDIMHMDDTKAELFMLIGWVFAVMIIAVVILYPYNDYQFTGLGISDGVNLYSCRYSEPSPMGIVDYGVTSYGNIYNLSTNSIKASITDEGMLTNISGNYNASIQLNSNVLLSYGNLSQTYFLQNVILIDSITNSIAFIDNVWNSSGINSSMNQKLIVGNGTVAPSTKNESYYFYEDTNQTGDNITLRNNQQIYLMTNSSINANGSPEIIFSYNDGYGWKEYDKVVFNRLKNVSNASMLISGFNYTPGYNFYDAGIIIGGPGAGSNTTMINGSLLLSIDYWNGNNFQAFQDAYNYGCDTEEGINNAVVNPKFGGNGLPFANITSGKDVYLGNLWSINSSSIGLLYINSSIRNLDISIYRNNSYINQSFSNGIGELTLLSGSYIIKGYENSNEIYYKNYTVSKGIKNYLNIS
ncbi:MAG: Peptidase A5, thermopsin [Candidatus Parvarchaeum acidophilus ARMAN-5]|jgi:hypothetical protein|uniref:Peptidase A5, thermopsin n=1 Tax=Candidatus Parvarchaeum acidophilus ARMAN-5 TaxID=662762 RepID=D6GUU5_PARA5|nr:MAG: Peptidase A5, thermopsin [Candidatus Parvarchaeum acidophilus ARMAN-5]